MSNNNISEEIISGWRSEANDYLNEHEQFASALGERIAIRAFIAAKTSSHERILELERELERLKAIIGMFQVHGTGDCCDCDTGRVTLFIANKKCISCSPSEYDKSFPEKSLNNEKEKLTKRDELLKEALPYIENADDCELSIGEKTINTEKWIKNYKQLEQEK